MIEQWQRNLFNDGYTFSVPLKKVKGIQESDLSTLCGKLSEINNLDVDNVQIINKTGYMTGAVTPYGPLNNELKTEIANTIRQFNKQKLSRKFYKPNNDDVLIPIRGEVSDFVKYITSLTLIKQLREEVETLKLENEELAKYKTKYLALGDSIKSSASELPTSLNQTEKFKVRQYRREILKDKEKYLRSVVFFKHAKTNKPTQGVIAKILNDYLIITYRGRQIKVNYESVII